LVIVQISRRVSLSGRERAFLLNMLSKFTDMNLRFQSCNMSDSHVTSRLYLTS
jgi:hypothetical protein